MGRGGRKDNALGTAPTRVSRSQSIDPASFDGVSAALDEMYTPYEEYSTGLELYQAIAVDNQASFNGQVKINDLDKNIITMAKNVTAIEETLLPALPRADALKASLLGREFAEQNRAICSPISTPSSSRTWHSSQCKLFFDMQDTYQQLVDLVAGHDPARHEEQRKREKAEARAARASEERASFDRRQRFQETISGISGSGS